MSKINVTAVIQEIKKAGQNSVRAIPMANQPIDGNYEIEIQENGNWRTVISGLKKPMAEDIIRQATNRVLLG